MEESRPRSHSVLQMRSSTFQVRASKFLKKVTNIRMRGSNRTLKDKNSEGPYMREIHSMDISHKPFMSQPTLGLQMPQSHTEADYSSRSVSSRDSSFQQSRQVSSGNESHPNVKNHKSSGRPNNVEEQEQRGRHRISTDVSRGSYDHARDRRLHPIDGMPLFLQPSFPGNVSKDSSHPNMSGRLLVPTKDEFSTATKRTSLDRQSSVPNERMGAKSKANTLSGGTLGESGQTITTINNGEVTPILQTTTSTPTPRRSTLVVSNLPPASLNRIGSTRLSPSLVIRHPPLPILHLPTLSPPTVPQPLRERSYTRLRSMPALPAEGPGDHEIEADHENAGLGDSDEEENGETDMDSNAHIGIETDIRVSLESSRSSQSGQCPKLVLPAVNTSHIDLSFLDQPYDSTSNTHRGQDTDQTPTTSHPLDYFSSYPERRESSSPTRTPRQGDMHFSPFLMMQNSLDNQLPISRLSPTPTRLSMYRHPSISMVDLGTKSQSDAMVTAAVNFEDERRNSVVQGKGKARESPNAATPVPLESKITEWQKGISEASPLRRRGSMPNFNRASVPPPYPSFAPHPMSKLAIIMPREEEGMERLPSYTNSIHLTAIMPRKMEFSAPGIQAKDRKWRRILCVLEGTAFKVYRCPRDAAGVGPIGEWWEKRVGVGDVSATPNTALQDSRMKVEGLNRIDMERQTKLGLDVSHAAGIHQPNSIPHSNVSNRNPSVNPSLHQNSSSRCHSRGRGAIPNVDSSQSSTTNSVSSQIGHSPSNLSVPTSRATSTSSVRSHLGLSSHPTERAGLIRGYTMQHAESGLGNDYTKRKNVIRLRLEGEQFLLQALDAAMVVEWIEAFQAAANIALDLDERVMPKGPFFPRRRRRRPRRVEAVGASRPPGDRLTTTD